MNRFEIIGRLGGEPRRFGNEGKAVGISLATSRVFKRENERVEATSWNDVIFFDKLADVVVEYLSKGDTIFVDGHVQRNCYDKNGVKTYSTDLVGRNVKFLITKKNGNRRPNELGPNNYEGPGVKT